MEESPKPPYSLERYQRCYTALKELFTRLLEKNDDNVMELQTEIAAHAFKLNSKYKGVTSEYAMYHVLQEEAEIRPDAVIKYEDFPGEDSVEKFIDALVKKYSN